MQANYALGLDIGSVNVKLVLLDASGSTVLADAERISAGPHLAVAALLRRAGQQVDLAGVTAAGVSGSGKGTVPQGYDWAEYSSALAVAAGVLAAHPDARTVIQVGGQTSLVVRLEDGLRRPWQVATNPLCAAGTGRFLEQQAYRLGIDMEQFAAQALACAGRPPRIAARCSVFAKSDLIHLQQKGVPVSDMLYALCESSARMVVSLVKGELLEPIYLAGGVAANTAFVRALSHALAARNGRSVEVHVPEGYLFAEARGAALLARQRSGGQTGEDGSGPGKAGGLAHSLERLLAPQPTAGRAYLPMPPLERPAAGANRTAGRAAITKRCAGYLGVDIGSTSTKAVILDETGTQVLAKHYLMTAGQPIEAVKLLFTRLIELGAGQVDICGVGVTGSGRYLVGSFIGADLVKNEITAQTRAAAEIDPDADIIEIGGQDSKLVLKRNGTVVDYQMNKACAAGTGSFIDEMAEMLDVSVMDGQFSELAFAAGHTVDLGTRCAAFMGQAVASAQQDRAPMEVITASLAVAIARNYLSKVVAHRKLGPKIILTGAVFYNQAVAAAFRQLLPDHTLIEAEHKEISGAIGAAMLAREAMVAAPAPSRFRGFQAVVDRQPRLTTFTCEACANSCAITRMQAEGEPATYYGSRCDRYDASAGHARQRTLFDERERLLLAEYRAGDGANAVAGSGPSVAIPRALLVHDYAPLLIGFLNALGAHTHLSAPTNKAVIEQSVELSYTDSCFPLKLLHGHMAACRDADFILYPSMVRLGAKDGEENQRYACPLVQASPYIARAALDLDIGAEGRTATCHSPGLLVPTIDFSQGPEPVLQELAKIAGLLGFDRRMGRAAAEAGLAAQEAFTGEMASLGRRALEELRQGDRPGVVLFARAYLAGDAGANLGIAEKLAQLGVVPLPLDLLPLGTVDPRRYSDRPYWHYESKLIAGAALVAEDPHLYGLALTNFGCGPNSFILRLVEDIMGEKPLGQLEIDEHAAEAGLVTRLEAFVDTIQAHAAAGAVPTAPRKQIYRGTSAVINTHKTLLIPRMSAHAHVLAAAMQACGANAVVLPEPDERNLLYANQVTSGVECLPYRVSLGDFIRAYHDMGDELNGAEAFMAGSYGPCRLGKYATEQMHALRELGIDITVRSTVSNHAYRDLGLGDGFERLAWGGIVAMDTLEKLLWRSRPYERETGAADHLFDEYTVRLAARVRRKEDFADVMRRAAADFGAIIDPAMPRRPRVGINGEIFLRANRFSNSDLAHTCERAGLEVVVSPMGEWFKYTAYRNVEDAARDRRLKKLAIGKIKQLVQERDERTISALGGELAGEREPSTAELLAHTARWLSPACGSEAVLSLGGGIEWLENPHFAGVISVMPHGCMPGGIVAAISERLSLRYGKPWINLTYDGFPESNNLARITNFAEVLRAGAG